MTEPLSPASDSTLDQTNSVEAMVVDAAPLVAYPERPWVAIAGWVGAIALGGAVLATMISGLKAREVGGVTPTRAQAPDTGLGSPIPTAPDLFAQNNQDPFAAPVTPALPVPETPQETGPPTWQTNTPPTPAVVSPPPPPPPPTRVIEYRDRFPAVQQPLASPPPAIQPAPPAVRPAADIGQRMRSPALIIDLSTPNVATPDAATPQVALPSGGDNDAFAARLATAETATAKAGSMRNPKTVVPQGAMISAILETAINSDLPGFVRAIVSRDVTSFDGSRVLIPRGSRLVGQYRSEVAIGQSRAFVIWTRVIRPDGVSVQIASPGTDPLGRAGLDGRVDRHYLQRFGPGLLTTAISAALSGNNRSNQLVIGTAQSAGVAAVGEAIKPTVTVAQGTAIQVFVSRDLDFSAVAKPAGTTQ